MLQRDNHDWRLRMLSAIREVQIPLLAAMLLGGSGAKAFRVLRARAVEVGLGPTALFPLRLRRPVAMFICAAELVLGIGLIVTATRAGAGVPATAVRVGVAVLFLTAVGALVELRERRPDAGCGCFGDLSVTPVGLRTIARSAVLAAAALATVGQPALHMPTSTSAAVARIAIFAVEVLVIAALSPEISESLVRLGYSEPCEVRRVSVERTLASLGGSAPWRKYARLVTSAAPADVWREGCWRYVVYPGQAGSRSVELIFAVYLRSRRPQIRTAVLDALTNEVLTGPQVSPVPDLVSPGWPEPEVAHPAGAAHLAGLARLLPDYAPPRPLVAAATWAAETTVAAGRTSGTGLAAALHLAAPVYEPDDPALPQAPVQAPVHPAHRGGHSQRAEHAHPARKPEGPVRPAPRRARHRSSAAF
jgi:hypothetical protein